ncbi:MAG: rod shape-determining protein MreB, partial [Gammaproteobacteria bacterium]
MLLDKLLVIYYVQIWPDRIRVRDARGEGFFDQKPLVAFELRAGKGSGKPARSRILAVGNAAAMAAGENVEIINPFLHPRSPVSDFMAAEVLLQRIFRSLAGN